MERSVLRFMGFISNFIEINFAEAIKKAEEIEEIAERLENVVSRSVKTDMEELLHGWKGDNASLFLKKQNPLPSEIEATIRDIRRISQRVRRIAQLFYDVEMKAVNIFSGKRY